MPSDDSDGSVFELEDIEFTDWTSQQWQFDQFIFTSASPDQPRKAAEA